MSSAVVSAAGADASVSPAFPVREIGGVPIHAATEDRALALISGDIAERFGIWTFANAHTINLARRDHAFLDILGSAVVLNDGIGVDLASRLLYHANFPANLNGTDFTPRVLAELPPGTRVFLLGGAPGVAERARINLARRYTQLEIAGVHHGFFDERQDDIVAELIARSDAALVLVAMGQPLQEKWAARNAYAVNATLLCVGAFLDFAAGRVPRAPDFVRRARMEWAYRLAIEPRRMARRYLIGNAAFLWAVMREWRARRTGNV